MMNATQEQVGIVRRQMPPAARLFVRSRTPRSSWLSLVGSVSLHAAAFALAAHIVTGGGGGDESPASSSGGEQEASLSVKVIAFAPAQHDEHRVVTKPNVVRKAMPAQQQRVFAAAQTGFPLPPPEPQAALSEPSVPDKTSPTASQAAVASSDEPPAKKAANRTTKRGSSSTKGTSGSGIGSGAGQGSGTASAPRPLSTRLPVYSYASKKRGAEGMVLVRVRVNESGRVESSTLHRSCGHADLDDAAVACVWKWTFAPGQAGGKTVESSAVVRVSFRLEG